MRQDKKSPTIQDVARESGVSVSTVSRVLNDKDDVAAETYERVHDVIRKMGYTSSLAARSMRSHRTNVIGLIVPDVEDSFSIQVMKGVNRAITEIDFDLIAYTSGSIKRSSSAERERHYVSLLNTSITDGIIIVTPSTTTFSTAAPVVAVDANTESPECPSVSATNLAGALSVMQYLLGLGHRRIGFIRGRSDLESANQRLEGYRAALLRAGIAIDPALIAQGDFTCERGYRSAQELLALPLRPTAIFAANDQSAIGTIRAARDAGLSVPEDLSVVGFDNIPEAAYMTPTLTTVDQFIDHMGYVATEMLIQLIQGEPLVRDPYKMPTQLIVRRSCREIGDGVQ